MPFEPGASWFVSFYEHDPSTDDQCIYFTQKETRCLWPCQAKDNQRAIELYETINHMPAEAVGIELIEEYILCNCCRSGRAKHRDRIVDVELSVPLAERWQREVREHAAEQSSREASVGPGEESVALLPTPDLSDTLTTAHTTPTTSRLSSSLNTPISSTTPSTVVTSSTFHGISSPIGSNASVTNTSLSSGDQPRYNLRPRALKTPAHVVSTRPAIVTWQPLSEFRAHIEEPGATDSASSRILDKLVDRDFETGSLYIFDRASSPGHVKIGWTAGAVSRRLESWSKCGYTPNLLFSVSDVPYAQRAESLAHYELIKEWRRERRCKVPECGKSHQEWFEVDRNRAEQVVGRWADFMKRADPYDEKGALKSEWGDLVTATIKGGGLVTGKKLLEHYELSLAGDPTPTLEPADPARAPKTEAQEESIRSIPTAEVSKISNKESLVQLNLLKIEEPVSTEETLRPESGPRPISLPRSKSHLGSDPNFAPGPLPKSQFSFTLESSFQTPSFPRTGGLLKTESLCFPTQLFLIPDQQPASKETQGLPESQMLHKPLFSFTAESPFQMQPLRTEASIGTKLSAKPSSVSLAESPRKLEPTPETETSVNTRTFLKSEFTFTSPLHIDPLPRTEAIFGSTPFKFESSWSTMSLSKTNLIKKSESLRERKLLSECISAEKALSRRKLSPDEIPLPPSPELRPIDY
ncbi:hypothetical protein GQ53DRAFT_399305 [Thozetella sp. PMI_491]|nr:hypothetical protein GQ53DRAFT_399305 [Thozetella sp. PMI_491]